MPLTSSVKSISWSPEPDNKMFAATSWDNSVRIFKADSFGIANVCDTQVASPALACCWNDDSTVLFLGCMDGTIKIMDVNTLQMSEIGKHQAPVTSLHHIPKLNILLSSAFENSIHFWQNGPQPVYSVNAGNKVYVSDYK